MTINESIKDLTDAIDMLHKSATGSRRKFPLAPADQHDHHFVNYLKSGESGYFEKSLLTSGGSGSLQVPGDTCMHVFSQMAEYSPLRCEAKIVKIDSDSLEVVMDDKVPTAYWGSEAQSTTEYDDSSFRRMKIPTHEIFANTKITQKLLDDSNVDIYEWFTSNIAKSISQIENRAFWEGDGEGKPRGILRYDFSNKSEKDKFQYFSTGVKGKFPEHNGVDILIDVVSSLKREYVRRACWIVSRSAYSAIQQLKNELGTYVMQRSLSGLPSTLLGYPMYIDDDLPELGDGTYSIVFGDFTSGYTIVDRSELSVFRDPYTSKPFVEFFATKRTGGAVTDFDALKFVRFC